MKKLSIFLYGAGKNYNKLIPVLNLYKQRIEIKAILFTNKPPFKFMDGFSCYQIDKDVLGIFDFIVITPEDWKEIFKHLVSLGVSENKVLLGKVFLNPYFQLDSYLELLKNNVSILSADCLAAWVYCELGLKFRSPTIWSRVIDNETYFDFLLNYEYYMSLEMELFNADKHKNFRFNNRWIGIIRGVIDSKLCWEFPHALSETDSVDRWNKYRKRVNIDNLAVLVPIYNEEHIRKFQEIKISKKIGFSFFETDAPDIVYCSEYAEDINIRKEYNFVFQLYIQDFFTNRNGYPGKIDWIKFLNGNQDYIRFE